MYFGIYQALTTATEDVFRQYRPGFFDLIIIDECHRGSSRDESAWRAVLDYFEPAIQFGMTATPLREESRDSYEYFGNPVYTYSLRQGNEDGFLAPYRVHCVITTVDAAGWRPSKDELDRYGREVPDDEYQTKDFERVVALRSLTRVMARHLNEMPVPSTATQLKLRDVYRQTQVLKAQHNVIRQANAALVPATLERVFANA